MSVPTNRAAFWSGVLSCLLGLFAAADEPWSDQDGLGFIATYCVDCHQPPKPKGGLDLFGQTSIPLLSCITFGPPLWLEMGEQKAEFLARARRAVLALKE